VKRKNFELSDTLCESMLSFTVN